MIPSPLESQGVYHLIKPLYHWDECCATLLSCNAFSLTCRLHRKIKRPVFSSESAASPEPRNTSLAETIFAAWYLLGLQCSLPLLVDCTANLVVGALSGDCSTSWSQKSNFIATFIMRVSRSVGNAVFLYL